MKSPFNSRSLIEDAERRPENLIIYSCDLLEGELSRETNGEDTNAEIIAELLIRHLLGGSPRIAKIIGTKLKHGELEDFSRRLPYEHLGRRIEERLWEENGNSFSERCHQAVLRRLNLLLKSEGLIPVFSDESGGLLLPFHFEASKDGSGQVLGLDKKPLLNPSGEQEWSQYCATMEEIKANVVVHIRQGNDRHGITTGNSLMLPLMLAWWRRQNVIPKFNPFSIVATGAVENGVLEAVDGVAEKAEAVRNLLYRADFFFPGCHDDDIGATGQQCHPLDIGFSVAENGPVFRRIRECIEGQQRWNADYVSQRLESSLPDEVRNWSIQQYDAMLGRLEKAKDGLNTEEFPGEYILILMLQSQLYCTRGLTDKAKDLNAEALEIAEEQGQEYLALRLQVNQIVFFTDTMEFEKIAVISPRMEEFVAACNDRELSMCFYGQMGMAHAYATLDGVKGFSKERALECFKENIKSARESGKAVDLAQDINYKCLYYALFEPGSRAEKRAFHDALSKIRDLEEIDQAAYKNNHVYYDLYRCFSFYRQLLRDKAVPPDYKDCPGLSCIEENSWRKALMAKYLGALRAASGETGKARKLFDGAIKTLNSETSVSTILGFIKATVYAEAYRSLGDSIYLEEGRKMFGNSNNKSHQAQVWKGYFDSGGAVVFPGLGYWY